MVTMPLYEYVCSRCSKNFEEIVYDTATTPVCPHCAQRDEVARIPFGKVMVGRKENLRPPNIKGMRPPRR
jgi:putative FmdB family regulatory protein